MNKGKNAARLEWCSSWLLDHIRALLLGLAVPLKAAQNAKLAEPLRSPLPGMFVSKITIRGGKVGEGGRLFASNQPTFPRFHPILQDFSLIVSQVGREST